MIDDFEDRLRISSKNSAGSLSNKKPMQKTSQSFNRTPFKAQIHFKSTAVMSAAHSSQYGRLAKAFLWFALLEFTKERD